MSVVMSSKIAKPKCARLWRASNITGVLDKEERGSTLKELRSLLKQKVITSLEGTLIDQTALFGVLMTLYDSRLPLLSVVFLGEDQPATKDSHAIP
jgi:hypothetical protein